MKFITSSENPAVKRLKKLEKRKYRDEEGLFIVEGLRACSLAAASPFEIDAFYLSEQFLAQETSGTHFWETFPCYVLSDKIFASVADTMTPQGILCTAKIPKNDAKHIARAIYLDNVRDPGNVGTIIRTADALGFDCVMLSEGCADLYSPKVIRSTMGSIFSVHTLVDVNEESLKEWQKNGYYIIASALSEDAKNLYQANFMEKPILVVGNEANGISDTILALADCVVNIPMFGQAESLNVSIAAALLMGEVSRREYEKQ